MPTIFIMIYIIINMLYIYIKYIYKAKNHAQHTDCSELVREGLYVL